MESINGNEIIEQNNDTITNEEQKEIADNLKTILINRLKLHIKPDDIRYDTQLFFEGLQLDSIDALELVIAIDENYEVSLNQENIDDFKNLSTLSKLVLEKRQENL